MKAIARLALAQSATWDSTQRAYWSRLAQSYDDLYGSRWSLLENAWVGRRLRRRVGSLGENPIILDLGCGTGLGAELVGSTSLRRYIGIDISVEMLAIAKKRHGVQTRLGAMDDLSWIPSSSVDLVISLFSAASFAANPEALAAEVSRVLKPGGMAYISVLGRARDGLAQPILFHTRGSDPDESGTYAHRFTPKGLRRLFESAGLSTRRLSAMNAFSGICELAPLWAIGRLIAMVAPRTSHLLEIECFLQFDSVRKETTT